MEAKLICAGQPSAAGIGLISSNQTWKGITASADVDYYVELFTSALSVYTLKFYVGGVEVYSETTDVTINTEGLRIRITLSGSEVRFVKNWVGAGTPAQYVSPVVPSYPLKVIAQVGNATTEKVVMTINPQPATIYTAAQQLNDFGLAQSQIKLRISQISSIVGKGGYAEAYLGEFASSDIAGCRLWLKADALTLIDGAAVSSFTDFSGNANHATQGTGANQPVYKTSILNGKSVVRFATNDYLTTPQVQMALSTFFVVYANRTGTNGSFHGGNGSAATGGSPLQRNTQVSPTDAGNISLSPDTLNDQNLYAATYNYTADTYAVWLNGVANGTSAAAHTVNTALFVTIGAGYGEFLNGDIAEVLIYDSVLSADDRLRVERYLMNKYGLT